MDFRASNRSIMVSYEKIIRQFLKLVFKWELFVSFRVQSGATIFILCATVQCIVLTYSCSIIYGLLRGCYN